MIDSLHIETDDLALYAMRLLAPEQSAAIAEHLKTCADCRAELQQAQGDLAIVALSVDLTTPSAPSRERFLTQVAREKRIIPIDRPAPTAAPSEPAVKPSRRSGQGGLLPWLGWALAAGVTFFAVGQYHERDQLRTTIAAQSAELKAQTAQMASLSAEAEKSRALMEALTSTAAMRVTLNTTPGPKAAPQGHANYLPSQGALVFIANNLESLPLDKVYELWVIPADGGAPLPAGTFHPDARGNASVVLPNIPKDVPAKAFGVTLEAEGGSAKPTLPILMVGQ